MLKNCAKSCHSCERAGENLTNRLEGIAPRESDELLMRTEKFGAIQIADGKDREATLENVKTMIDYMENSDDFLGLSSKIQENCKNKVRPKTL